MSKIIRKTSTPFALSAAYTDVCEFGSLTSGALVYSSDPAVIQSLPAWQSGWSAAQYGGVRAPYLEDRNAVDLVTLYQLSDIFQEGIPEWDANTIYFTGSIVNQSGQIFVSQQDNNQGNQPPASSSNAYWSIYFLPATVPPTRTVLTTSMGTSNGGSSSSAPSYSVTYTTPAGCKRIFIRMVGGGGGGAGAPFQLSGQVGGMSAFGTRNSSGIFIAIIQANGGSGGYSTGSPAAPGGTATGGDVNIQGGAGESEYYNGSIGIVYGPAGSSVFGGAGYMGNNNSPGISAAEYSGAGGGAASNFNQSLQHGAAGGYCEKTIINPLPQYAAYIGDGGKGGPGNPSNGYDSPGGNGGSGIIIIDEYYY